MKINCINLYNNTPAFKADKATKTEQKNVDNNDNHVLRNTLDYIANSNRKLLQETNSSAINIDLKRFARKDLRSSKQAEELFERFPDTNRFIGHLPYNWISHMKVISQDKMSEYTNQVFELFANFAETTSSRREDPPKKYTKEMEEFCRNFQALTGKKARIEYLNQGTIGRTYKFTVEEQDYVIKTFFTNPVKLGYYTLHGKGAEILGAVYAQEHLPKGHFADFYFGKFAKHDDLDGFMVTKYIDYNNAKTSYLRNLALQMTTSQPIESHDVVDNTVLDTVIEYGECRKGKLKTKRQYKIQRLITQAVLAQDKERFNKICTEYAGEDLDLVIKTLRQSFEMLVFCSKYPDVDTLSADEIKIIKNDNYNRLFRMIYDAVINHNYDAYKQILQDYDGTEELEYILSVYNMDMPEEERNIFSRRLRKTEIERISEIFKDFGIIPNPN